MTGVTCDKNAIMIFNSGHRIPDAFDGTEVRVNGQYFLSRSQDFLLLQQKSIDRPALLKKKQHPIKSLRPQETTAYHLLPSP